MYFLPAGLIVVLLATAELPGFLGSEQMSECLHCFENIGYCFWVYLVEASAFRWHYTGDHTATTAGGVAGSDKVVVDCCRDVADFVDGFGKIVVDSDRLADYAAFDNIDYFGTSVDTADSSWLFVDIDSGCKVVAGCCNTVDLSDVIVGCRSIDSFVEVVIPNEFPVRPEVGFAVVAVVVVHIVGYNCTHYNISVGCNCTPDIDGHSLHSNLGND